MTQLVKYSPFPPANWRIVPRRLLPLALAFVLLLAPAASGARASGVQVWSGTVTHVTDGDTLWVRPRRGGPPRVIRLDGIDAPERCQPDGEAARAALVGRVLGQTIEVRGRQRDDYGRLLARIRLHGEDVGAWLVRRGHAWSYRYRGDPGPYARQEAQARAQHIGLFRRAQPMRPRDFRRQHGPCR